MNKQVLTIFLLAITVAIFGQGPVDALRYSQHSIGGTARSVAMGGAFGALGGDFSTLSSNPAGLGVYRKSEFTFTPEFYYSNTNSRYQGETNQEGKFNFNFSNLGYVGSFMNSDGFFKGVNIGVGFNRLANFNKNTTISGVNNISSLGDYMADDANIYGLDAFTSALFLDSEVILSDELGYYLNNGEEGYIDINGGFIPTVQSIIKEETGRISERTFSVGVNLGDMLYLGTTFGWHRVIYDSESIWMESEDPIDENSPPFQYFDYTESLKVRGDGYTAKLGAIFTPFKALRVGAAIHLPVYYSIKEEYKTNISSRYIDWQVYYPIDDRGYDLDYFESKYNVSSPAKFIGSAASVIGSFLIVSADVEYIDYSTMKMKPTIDYNDANEDIKDIYSDVVNVKLGSELRFGQTYLRGGVGFYGSPYANLEENSDAYRISYSAGLGFRDNNFFIDLAYQYVNYDERQILYVVDNYDVYDAPAANVDTKAFRLMTTVGFRF